MRGVRGVRGLAIAAGALLTLALSGCTAAILFPLVQGTGTTTGTTGTGTTAAPPIQHYSDGSTSVRGNIPKIVGAPAGILTSGGTTRLVTFVVERIVPVASCVNADTTVAANDRYVEVDLQVITTADMGTDGADPTVSFSPDNWYYYPGGGNGGVGASPDSDNCQLATAPLPDTIGPAQTVQGSILLDVSNDSAYISYNPGAQCGCEGLAWEWPIPQG